MNRSKLIIILGAAILCVVIILCVMLLMILPNLSGNTDKLVFTSESIESYYDGSVLKGESWSLVSGTLKSGHTADVKVTGSQRYVGTSQNLMQVRIVDSNGADVTSDYNIECVPGTLTVKPVNITVTSASDSKVYDREPLINHEYNVVPAYAIPPRHEVNVEVTGWIMNVGKTSNTVSKVTIYDESGKDVTFNFNIVIIEGVLEVTDEKNTDDDFNKNINIDTDGDRIPDLNIDVDKDGIPDNNLDVDEDGFADTNIDVDRDGTPDLNIDIDGDGIPDVNMDWDGDGIASDMGDIELGTNMDVNGDGMPDINLDIDGDGFADINIDVDGDGIPDLNIDTDGNLVPDVNLDTDRDGEPNVNIDADRDMDPDLNVDTNGDIIADTDIDVDGDGKVDKNPSGDGPGVVDGPGKLDTSGNISGGPLGDSDLEDLVCYILTSDYTDTVYLKVANFGSYNGRQWKAPNAYDRLINSEYSAEYLAAAAMQNGGKSPKFVFIDVKNGQTVIPYYTPMYGSIINNKSDVFVDSVNESYIEFLYYNDGYSGVEMPKELIGYEKRYRDFVYQNYLEIDIDTYQYMQKIIAEQGFSADSSNVIEAVATYIQNAAAYNLKYDRKLDDESNIVVAFLDQYKEGICQHYASAATLLYRALGIPARYTVGFSGNTVAGKSTEVTGSQAHAWVEVYIDGIGWIVVEVTGGSGNPGGPAGPGGPTGPGGPIGPGGSDDQEGKKLITVTPVNCDKKYDGQPLFAENAIKQNQNIKYWSDRGYTFDAVVSGERTEPGKSGSVIVDFHVYDPSGNEVTDQFKITYKEGTVHVYLEEFSFASTGIEKEYDGIALEGKESDVTFTGISFPSNYTWSATPSSSAYIISAGSCQNSFGINIWNENYHDVTDMYKIVTEYGTLKVSPRSIVVTAGSATASYTGETLVCNDIDVSGGELAEGDYISEYVVAGSQTERGRSDNIVKSIKIVDRNGQDVTANYSIIFEKGTLRVTN